MTLDEKRESHHVAMRKYARKKKTLDIKRKKKELLERSRVSR
jgi:hypothetical protein